MSKTPGLSTAQTIELSAPVEMTQLQSSENGYGIGCHKAGAKAPWFGCRFSRLLPQSCFVRFVRHSLQYGGHKRRIEGTTGAKVPFR